MNRNGFLKRLANVEAALAANGGTVSGRRIEWARRLYRNPIHTERFLHVLTSPYDPRVVLEFRLDQLLLRQPDDDRIVPVAIDSDPSREAVPSAGRLRLTAIDPRGCDDPFDDDSLPMLLLFQERGDPLPASDLAGLPDGLYLQGNRAVRVQAGRVSRRVFGGDWKRMRKVNT